MEISAPAQETEELAEYFGSFYPIVCTLHQVDLLGERVAVVVAAR